MWHIFSGETPYSECENECQIAFKIYMDEKLEIPSDVPAEIKNLIKSCWQTPCKIDMDAAVAILENADSNVESIEYITTCPIPVDLF